MKRSAHFELIRKDMKDLADEHNVAGCGWLDWNKLQNYLDQVEQALNMEANREALLKGESQ